MIPLCPAQLTCCSVRTAVTMHRRLHVVIRVLLYMYVLAIPLITGFHIYTYLLPTGVVIVQHYGFFFRGTPLILNEKLPNLLGIVVVIYIKVYWSGFLHQCFPISVTKEQRPKHDTSHWNM